MKEISLDKRDLSLEKKEISPEMKEISLEKKEFKVKKDLWLKVKLEACPKSASKASTDKKCRYPTALSNWTPLSPYQKRVHVWKIFLVITLWDI